MVINDQDENNVITITGDDASEFSVQDKFIYLKAGTDLSIGQTLEYKINVIATDKVDSNIRFSESMIITIELNASKDNMVTIISVDSEGAPVVEVYSDDKSGDGFKENKVAGVIAGIKIMQSIAEITIIQCLH